MARRFRPGPDGIEVALVASEREGLATMLERFRAILLGGKDSSLLRLQPPVHINNPEASEDFWSMVGDPLLRHRLEAIDIVEQGLDSSTLDEEAAVAWMQTINSVRIYMGNSLEVGSATFNPPPHDESSPASTEYFLYEYLGMMLDDLVTAAAETLPESPTASDD